MTGTLYGLGIGPGDPELLTLKAYHILQKVKVIAYPAPVGQDSLARAIVASHLPGHQDEIVIETPMVPGSYPAHEVYDQYSREIAQKLDAGLDVAVLCEGDPFFYGSFMYLFERLAGDYATEVVPGVSSMMASCCMAGVTISSRNESLVVLPAPMDSEDLLRRLELCDAAIIMKVGRHLDKVIDVLATLGLSEHALYVERATMAAEKIMPLEQARGTKAPYFSMVLVQKNRIKTDHDDQ